MPLHAWSTDSHLDSFARNIIAGHGGSAAEAGQAARTINEFTSNAVQVHWPTFDELAVWAEANSYSGETVNARVLMTALRAAISRLSERCQLPVHTVDSDGNVNTSPPGPTVPPEVHLAVLLQAYRWARRQQTPEGVVGANEFTGAIRASRLDPDVEAMIANHVVYGLA